MRRHATLCVAGFIAVLTGSGLTVAQGTSAAGDPYEVGGPLQGVKLPLFPVQHGENPGYPGCIPALQKPEGPEGKQVTPFTSEGMPPERLLFNGSVEHFRAYWFKYLPVKNFFDRQTLLKNFPAKDLAPAEDYAEPVSWVPRYREVRPTGMFNAPVKVVRCKVGAPTFALDFGNLPESMYVVRVVGAVETKDLVRHRRPVILKLTVNDGLGGETSTYRFRCKYVDEFYVVAEFYFNAPLARAYKGALTVDEGSLTDLLVHNIELHDALAGYERRAIKTKSTLAGPMTAAFKPVALDEPRLARDAELWDSYPPLNCQWGYTYGMGGDDPKSNWPNLGAGGLTPKEIADKYGAWTPPQGARRNVLQIAKALLVNDTLKLEYTVDDLRAGRSLPDPYPFKDRGQGVYTPSAKEGEDPQNWYPVPDAVKTRVGAFVAAINAGAKAFREKGDAAAGHEAAVMLCRLAYDFPGLDVSNSMSCILLQPGPYGRDLGCRQRDPRPDDRTGVLPAYDELFDLIRKDPGIAQSVGRFIPSVKTPQDVVRLIDVRLVQTVAEHSLRYHTYFSNEPALIVTPAIVLGDTKATDPWMEWLFSATFVYPLPPSGIEDLLVTGNDRDGIGDIGSFSYAQSEQAAPKAMVLEKYLAAGGNPKFDLRDPKRYPKPIAATYWTLDTRMAGLYFPRVGDVGGPDKVYGQWFNDIVAQSSYGWRWTKDPQFAWYLKNFGKPGDFTPEEWAEIGKAAATVDRAPFLNLRSRLVSNWFGVLESGVEQDDFRFRRDAMLRVGQGWGHQHSDTLDLQIYAHGYPMTIDGGQRGGYSAPADGTTRVHNLVEVDNKDWIGHSWVKALSDTEGARYLSAEAEPAANHPNVKLYRRQVALVDVDEGRGGAALTVEQLKPGARLKTDVTTPNSYVFDVVRVSGGQTHTYCFHATVEDELVTNAEQKVGADALPEADREYLRKFPLPEQTSAGAAPAVAEATWRMCREPNVEGGRPFGAERNMALGIWNPDSPRKFTRLHLFDHAGDRMMTGALLCKQWGYRFTNLFVQHRGEAEGDAVFPAVIEPFVGEAFITAGRSVPVQNNETDALKAVAVEVKTKNGHTDLLFADGRPEKVRQVEGARVAAEFACVSQDADGLRLATLTGGSLLETPQITIKPAAVERSGKIVQVNYEDKIFFLDQAWPAAPLLKDRVFEVGVPGHMTAYTIRAAQPNSRNAGNFRGAQVAVTGGADFYLSRVREVDAQARKVVATLAIPHTWGAPCPGVDKHWVASNEDATKFWRAEYLGGSREDGRYNFQLDGPVALEDFGKTGGFRLWEYGAGDTVRQSTFACVRRVKAGIYEVRADVDLEVKLPDGKTHKITTDELAKNNGVVFLNSGK